MMLKRRLSAMLTACLLIVTTVGLTAAVALNVSAAQGIVTFSAAAKKWSAEISNYVALPGNSTSAGDVIGVFVKAQTIEKLSGIDFTLEYNNSTFTYLLDSATSFITDSNGQVASNADTAKGSVRVLWDTTTSGGASVGLNDMFVLRFSVPETGVALNDVKFKFTINTLYYFDTKVRPIEMTSKTFDVGVNVAASATVPQNLITAMQKLVTIEYTKASMDNIIAAENLYAGLTSAVKVAFAAQYPELYQAFSTARTRYSAAAEKADQDAVIKAKNDFLQANAAILAKLPKDLKEGDSVALEALETQYGMLGVRSKALLTNDEKKKIEELIAAIEAVDDVTFFNSFHRWIIDANVDVTLLEHPGVLLEQLNEIIGWVSGRSALSLEFLKNEKKELDKLEVELKAALGTSEEELAIQAETRAYQLMWNPVFFKTADSVEIGDELAIRMAIADYNKLSPEAKNRLAYRLNIFNSLLLVIESLKETEKEVETITVTNTVNNTITQTLEVPVENQVLVEIPTEQIVEVPVEVQVKEVVEVPVKGGVTKVQAQKMSDVIYWLMLLAGISVILLIYPVISYYNAVKKGA